MIQSRRRFFQLALGAPLALKNLARGQSTTAVAVASGAPPSTSVLRYPAMPDADDCLEERRRVGEQLGSTIEQQLKLVVDSKGQFALVWDSQLSDAELDVALVDQNKKLGAVGIAPATKVASSDFRDVFDVRYGDPLAKQADAEKLFEDIYRVLGPSVGKDLVIQRGADGLYSVVFRALCDEDACDLSLDGQQDALDALGVDTELIPEQDPERVYGEASYLDAHRAASFDALAKPPEQVPGLQEAVIAKLQAALRPGETAAVYVVDLQSGNVLVHSNETRPMECASMVKPFVAVAFFYLAEIAKEPGFVLDDAAKRDLQKMIQDSDNDATNRFFLRLAGVKDFPALQARAQRKVRNNPDKADFDAMLKKGAQKAQALLQEHYGDLLSQLHIVEGIPGGGKTYENRASLRDYSQLMLGLHHRRFPGSAEILRVMALPKKHPNRLYDGVPEIPRGTLCYDKTGTTNRAVGNIALMMAMTKDGHRRGYFIGIVVDRPKEVPGRSKPLGAVMRQVSGMTFTGVAPVYDFELAPPPSLPPVNRKLKPRRHRLGRKHHRSAVRR